MANPEHVEVVRGGPAVLSQWLQSHFRTPLDLKNAELAGVDLLGAKLGSLTYPFSHDFSYANLREAELSNADLKDVTLKGAALVGASLMRADLQLAEFGDADLTRATLWGANASSAGFRRANLTAAVLNGANLILADFEEAAFAGAHMIDVLLGGTNLSGAKGLELVEHHGPSFVDERALRRSWPLPAIFLRGVGLSDQLITYLPSLFGQAFEFYSCFISYSSGDDDFARRLHADLQDRGVRCWFAPENLKVGDKFRPRIDEAIRLHDKLLLILSEHSVRSPWVESEVEAAFEKERKASSAGEERTVLFPIRLDDVIMNTESAWASEIRRTRHIGNFTRWKEHDEYKEAFARLLRDLKS